MIQGLFQSGSLAVTEKLVQFTGARHAVITHNIANLSTPHFRPRDLDPKAFQTQLAKAVDERRTRLARGAGGRDLRMKDSRQVKNGPNGLETRPETLDENILFHDRNNRDLERTMQDLAENTMAHTAGLELLKSDFEILKIAIRGRV
ncbi:MAG: hypothetical protein V3V20_04650 [Algisphaera sp.]